MTPEERAEFDSLVEAELADLKAPEVTTMLEEMNHGWPMPAVSTSSEVHASIIDANNAWMSLSDMQAQMMAEVAAAPRTRNLQVTFNRVTAGLSFLAGLALGIGGTGIIVTAVR